MTLSLSVDPRDLTTLGLDLHWKGDIDGSPVILVADQADLEDELDCARGEIERVAWTRRNWMQSVGETALSRSRELERPTEPGTKIPKTPWLRLTTGDYDQ